MIVGSLLYLALVSHPDISYAVGVHIRHLKYPTYASSCKAASRVLNYFPQHLAVCNNISSSRLDLHVYTDSDWGSDENNQQSTTGVLNKMTSCHLNCVVCGYLLVCFYAIQTIVWICQVLKDINPA